MGCYLSSAEARWWLFIMESGVLEQGNIYNMQGNGPWESGLGTTWLRDRHSCWYFFKPHIASIFWIGWCGSKSDLQLVEHTHGGSREQILPSAPSMIHSLHPPPIPLYPTTGKSLLHSKHTWHLYMMDLWVDNNQHLIILSIPQAKASENMIRF